MDASHKKHCLKIEEENEDNFDDLDEMMNTQTNEIALTLKPRSELGTSRKIV